MTKEEIFQGQERLQAAIDCGNLMMNGSALLMANLTREYVEEWAKRPDCTLAMPWGCYDGYEGVKRCFTVDHRDINDEGAFELLKGSLSMDSLSGEVIHVAEDCKTARAVYIIHRFETNPTNNELPEHSRKSYWNWGWYGVDFINEDGEWKLWHLRLFPCFKVPFGQNWAEYPYEGFELRMPTCDRPAMPIYVPGKDVLFPDEYPALPKPYKTFADVAPGYGYEL